jgi:hypothetical protein
MQKPSSTYPLEVSATNVDAVAADVVSVIVVHALEHIGEDDLSAFA